MALIKELEKLEKERYSDHSETRATYSVFSIGDCKYLQIDTYGSTSREYKGKVSQSIQLDEEEIKKLVNIIISNFGTL